MFAYHQIPYPKPHITHGVRIGQGLLRWRVTTPKGAAIAPLALYTTEFDSSDCPALGEPMPPPPTAEWVTLEVAGGGPPSARLLCFSLQVEQTWTMPGSHEIIALVEMTKLVLNALTLRTNWTSVLVDLHGLDEWIIGFPLGIRAAVDQSQLGWGRVRAAGVAYEGGSLRRGRGAFSQLIGTLRFRFVGGL